MDPGAKPIERIRLRVIAGTRAAVAWMLEAGAALVPDSCVACARELEPVRGRAVDRPRGLCAPCASAVMPLGFAFCLDETEGERRRGCRHPRHLRLRAAVQYGSEIAALVRRTKFHDTPQRLAAWEDVWRAASKIATGTHETPDLLVPVPAHPARVRERGFDVTAAWADRLSRLEGVPAVRALVRRRATPPQVGLDRARRVRNVAGAFAGGGLAPLVHDRRVALVDDVVTTGSTVRAAADAVRAAGARTVQVWAFAYEPLE